MTIRENAPIEPKGAKFELPLNDFGSVVMGDIGGAFKPTAVYSPFGDSTGVVFGWPTQKNHAPKADKGVVSWTDGDTLVRFFEHAERDRWHRGAIETEVWLAVKPPKPEVPFRFEYSGLVLHEQPALTQFELDRGNTRPADMIGGYCAYHATKHALHFIKGDADRYQTGKAFDLPRPTATDVHGTVVLGFWRHEPQNFLLVAVFEEAALAALDWSDLVRIGPTIGYTALGASNDGTGQFALANSYVAGANGDGSAGTAYYGGAMQITTATVYIAVYDFGDGNISSNNRLAVSSGITLLATANAFRSAAITPPSFVNGTTYFIENYSNTTGVSTAYDTTAGQTNQYTATGVNASPPDPHVARSGTQANFQPSGYIDFTAAAAGGGPSANSLSLMGIGV